jgi:hypothetical protein
MAPSNETLLEKIASVESRHDEHLMNIDISIKNLWKLGDKLRDRLPLWCVIYLNLLSAICAGLAVKLLTS